MDKILKGILKYRHTFRHGMVEQFVQVKDNPSVSMQCSIILHYADPFCTFCVGSAEKHVQLVHSRALITMSAFQIQNTKPTAVSDQTPPEELECLERKQRHQDLCSKYSVIEAQNCGTLLGSGLF